MTKPPQAPHGLDLVIDFVNTLDVETSTDALGTPIDLAVWLEDRILTTPHDLAPQETDRLHAIRLREALRTLMLSNNTCEPDDQAFRQLESSARHGELSVHFDASGITLAPCAGGVDGVLARMLVPIAHAIADDTWGRVKACRSPGCQWAFYDRSRNRSGVWCDMAVCGNRTKVRAYRDRGPRDKPR